MRKFGVHYAVWGTEWETDLCERVKKAAKLGFDVVELTPPAFMANLEKNKMMDLKKCADDNNVELSYCIGFAREYDMASEDADVRKRGMDFIRNILSAVSIMDGKILSGILYSYWPYDFSKPVPDKERAWERALASVKECVKVAEDLGITYAIELVNRFEHFILNSVEEGIEFVNQVGSKNCKLLLDTFHSNIEEPSTAGAIVKAGDLLAHIHVCQNNRMIPFEADNMPWDSIARAVKQINFNGRIVMEPFVLKGGPVGRDIHIWRNLIDNTAEEYLEQQLKEGLEFIKSKMK